MEDQALGQKHSPGRVGEAGDLPSTTGLRGPPISAAGPSTEIQRWDREGWGEHMAETTKEEGRNSLF